MRAINHELVLGLFGTELLFSVLDAFGIVVRALVPTAENCETIIVASCSDNSYHARFGD